MMLSLFHIFGLAGRTAYLFSQPFELGLAVHTYILDCRYFIWVYFNTDWWICETHDFTSFNPM